MVIDNVYKKVPEMIIEKFNDKGVYIVKNLEKDCDIYKSLPYTEENIHCLLRYDKEEIFYMERMLEKDLLTFGEVKESGEVILPEPKCSYDKIINFFEKLPTKSFLFEIVYQEKTQKVLN